MATAKTRTAQRKKTKQILLKSLLSLGILVALFSIAYFFKVEQVICLVEGQMETEICSNLNFLHGESLFFSRWDHTPLLTEVHVNNQGRVYQPIKMQKRLPSTLIITFNKEDPWYRLEWQNKTYVVNSHGYLTSGSHFPDLPLVKAADTYQHAFVDNQIDHELNKLIYDYLDYSQQLVLNYDYLFLNQDRTYFEVDGMQYMFNIENDPASIVTKMKLIQKNFDLILEQVEPGQSVQAIDFNFKLPVVRLSESSQETELDLEMTND